MLVHLINAANLGAPLVDQAEIATRIEMAAGSVAAIQPHCFIAAVDMTTAQSALAARVTHNLQTKSSMN